MSQQRKINLGQAIQALRDTRRRATPDQFAVAARQAGTLTPAGFRSNARELVRLVGKAAFAAADPFLGSWPGPRILIYHQIGAGSGRQMDLEPALFSGHVDWLMSQGKIVGLGDALSGADDPDSHRQFVLTFDDGYADFYENAYPSLRDLGIPFTLYLTTSPIETGMSLHAGDRPLTWDMVGEMVDTGLVTMGAHTHTHPDLRHLSADEVEQEIEVSNDLIRTRTGQAPRHFAYPKGFWDANAETVIRRHYSTATVGAGAPVTGATSLFRVHRVPVQASDGQFFFSRKIKSGMRLEERVRRLVKGYEHPPR